MPPLLVGLAKRMRETVHSFDPVQLRVSFVMLSSRSLPTLITQVAATLIAGEPSALFYTK
jgi:hypothetical protein